MDGYLSSKYGKGQSAWQSLVLLTLQPLIETSCVPVFAPCSIPPRLDTSWVTSSASLSGEALRPTSILRESKILYSSWKMLPERAVSNTESFGLFSTIVGGYKIHAQGANSLDVPPMR